MHGNYYQKLASKFINKAIGTIGQELHALHGLAAEVGEVHSIYQKGYQGHEMSEEHLKKEIGDCLWMLTELCTTRGFALDEIMQMNIDKLEARYPNGFEVERSINRKEGDI